MKDRRRNRNGWVPVTSQLEEEYMGGVESASQSELWY